MRLLSYELVKCLFTPAIWVYLVLCMAINTFLVIGFGDPSQANDLSRKLSGMKELAINEKDTSNDFEPRSSIDDTGFEIDVYNVYDGYDTSQLADAIVKNLNITGNLEVLIRKKYQTLQTVVDSYAKQGVGSDVYAGYYSSRLHNNLFDNILKCVTLESALFAALTILYLLGCESNHKTSTLVYSSTVGRKIMRKKGLAGLLCTIVGFLLITGYTLMIYFSIWDYSGFMNGNVASSFNEVLDFMGNRPFITWRSFTLNHYLITTLTLSLLLVIAFYLLGGVLGLWISNAYTAFLVFALLFLGMACGMFLCKEIGLPEGWFASLFTLAPLWITLPQWFTDMGGYSLIPYHETFAIFGNLLLLWIVMWTAYRRFLRKDLIV